MGRTVARGYGYAHKLERKRWAALLSEGPLPCSRCGYNVTAAMRWDLDHTDDRTGYRGVAHASCNRRAPRLRAAIVSLKSSRSW